ncbi:hypothetical protein CKSOR_00516 [Candidatus Kinetoplastibacterium sorsogonicusi]|uniref:Thioredoxin domain-containing protein n=1 Tax=Candidatus Kinetoplastidibacterium kentomonadis TaxID=1576550 RepID=A0A3Q8ERT9_9PROT|nr:thioredoxin family protein [Candidatus Kinetoplastibacterium sorsogonicusi]AWD32622.1 hypothetical protein CKSOR_00516 [Candidatus Kinetoplastibacterium sorsogonicusi]
MPLIIPNSNDNNFVSSDMIVCFCASWCSTCIDYKKKLEIFSNSITEYSFIWLDIDDHEHLIGDIEIENFPTILIKKSNKNVFFGTISSNILVLEKMLSTFNENKSTLFKDIINIDLNL